MQKQLYFQRCHESAEQGKFFFFIRPDTSRLMTKSMASASTVGDAAYMMLGAALTSAYPW